MAFDPRTFKHAVQCIYAHYVAHPSQSEVVAFHAACDAVLAYGEYADRPEVRWAVAGPRLAPWTAGVGRRPSAYDLAGAKAVLHAHALASGDWSLIAPHKRADVARALKVEVPPHVAPPPAAPPRQPEGPQTVTFAFPWRPRGSATAAVGEASAAVVPLRADEVRHGARLRSGGRDEAGFAVLRHGDAWLRPVFAPGSWEPVTFDTFVEAVRTGTAWCDNPFLHESRPDSPALDLADYAVPFEALGRGHPARREAAAAAAAGRAGPLFVVDGVVHRTAPAPAPAPEIVLARRDGEERRADRALPSWDIRPHWRMGDLDSTMSMSTTDARWRTHRHVVLSLTLGGRGRPEVDHPISFPVSRHVEAMEVTKALLTMLDTRAWNDVRRRMGGKAFRETGYVPVTDVADEEAPGHGEGCLRDALRILEAGPIGAPTDGMLDLLRAGIVEASPDLVSGLREAARIDSYNYNSLAQAMFWSCGESPAGFVVAALSRVAADAMEKELALDADAVADDVATFVP